MDSRAGGTEDKQGTKHSTNLEKDPPPAHKLCRKANYVEKAFQ